jgi:two-component system, cell cycle response regulator CpdR
MAEPQKVVMLVDDEPSVLELYGVGLEQYGFRVVKAGTAAVALQRGRDLGRIDVLVTDVVLLGPVELEKRQQPPVMHGIELMRRMVELQPDVKVILFSGYAQDMIEKLGGIPPAGTIFLRKPFTVETLTKTITRLLGRQATRVPKKKTP